MRCTWCYVTGMSDKARGARTLKYLDALKLGQDPFRGPDCVGEAALGPVYQFSAWRPGLNESTIRFTGCTDSSEIQQPPIHRNEGLLFSSVPTRDGTKPSPKVLKVGTQEWDKNPRAN